MAQSPARRVADLDWAFKAAHIVADALVAAKALFPEQHNRAVAIIMHEIYDLLAMGDRPVT